MTRRGFLVCRNHLIEGHAGGRHAEAFFLEFLLAMLHGRNGDEVDGREGCVGQFQAREHAESEVLFCEAGNWLRRRLTKPLSAVSKVASIARQLRALMMVPLPAVEDLALVHDVASQHDNHGILLAQAIGQVSSFTLMRGAFFLTQATLVTKAQPQGDAHR